MDPVKAVFIPLGSAFIGSIVGGAVGLSHAMYKGQVNCGFQALMCSIPGIFIGSVSGLVIGSGYVYVNK